MSVKPRYENMAVAGRFFEKFGFGEIDVDKFDMFIIDEGLASDPETYDTKSASHKGFIQERSQARGKLNRGGAHHETPFQVDISRPGVEYVVSPWGESAQNIATEMGNRVREYAKNRFAHLERLSNRSEGLLMANPEDREMQEVTAMLGLMRQEGVQLQARVRGLVHQYNAAAEAVEQQVIELLERYDEAKPEGLPTPADKVN